jgi:hypothetical protein
MSLKSQITLCLVGDFTFDSVGCRGSPGQLYNWLRAVVLMYVFYTVRKRERYSLRVMILIMYETISLGDFIFYSMECHGSPRKL